MSQVAYQSTQTAASDNGGSGTSLSINIPKPVSLAVGDLMIAQVSAFSGSGSLVLPAGWTLIHPIRTQSSLGVLNCWKTADASDVAASTFTFSLTGASNGSIALFGAIHRYINAHPTAPINAESDANANSPTVTLTTGTITPAQPSLLLLLLTYNRSSGGTTASSYAVATSNPSWTERLDDNSSVFSDNLGLAMADGSRSAVTATGSGSVVTANTVGNYNLALIAISPAPVRPAAFLGGTFGINTVLVPVKGIVLNAATFGFLAPAVDIIAPLWRNAAKHASDWVNAPKS